MYGLAMGRCILFFFLGVLFFSLFSVLVRLTGDAF
jgi:hypothetical protein